MITSSNVTPSIDVLSNGVTLLNAPLPSRNVGVVLIVRAGSRDETPDTAGLAHFLEHMFFKGTKRRPTTMQISREIDRLGAATNAYTDTEEVAYYAEGPARTLPELADIITDMLSRPLFDAAEVELERNVVLQELAARLLDPDGWIWDRLGTVAFGGDQPMSWSAAGFPAVVEKVSRDELVDYHMSFYAPEAMALVVAGGERIGADQAEALLADIPRATSQKRVPATWGTGERYVANVRQFTAAEEPQFNMVVALPGLPALDEDRTALAVMTHILGGGMSSRLFDTVRARNGLCYSIFAQHAGYEDTGIFAIDTATRPHDAERALELSFAELRRMATEPVGADELDAAKSAMIGRLLRGTETAGASARYYSSRWRARLLLESPDDRAAAISQITPDDVIRAGRRIVERIDEVRLAFVGPEDFGDRLLTAVGTGAATAS